MKNIKISILFLLVLIFSGCTVDITNNRSSSSSSSSSSSEFSSSSSSSSYSFSTLFSDDFNRSDSESAENDWSDNEGSGYSALTSATLTNNKIYLKGGYSYYVLEAGIYRTIAIGTNETRVTFIFEMETNASLKFYFVNSDTTHMYGFFIKNSSLGFAVDSYSIESSTESFSFFDSTHLYQGVIIRSGTNFSISLKDLTTLDTAELTSVDSTFNDFSQIYLFGGGYDGTTALYSRIDSIVVEN